MPPKETQDHTSEQPLSPPPCVSHLHILILRLVQCCLDTCDVQGH
jgi:hypothetical protein